MTIIAISGLAGSGKDTVANILLQDDVYVKVSLADPLKRVAKELWNFSNEQLWGPSEFRNAPDERYPLPDGTFLTPRKVLQHLGTEGCRVIDPDIWIRKFMEVSTRLLSDDKMKYSPYNGLTWGGNPTNTKAVVCADCRFNNELKYIKEYGGIFIKVERPSAGLEGEFATHQSESETVKMMDNNFDYVIQNTGTLDDLRDKIFKIKEEFSLG